MTAERDATEDTPAIRVVAASGVPFRVVQTERAGSAEESAELQGIELGQLIRSIVVRRGAGDYVFVLVPGGRQIAWTRLRAHLGVSRLSLPDQDEARDATGYERGTITPFASSTAWPVVADATLVDRAVVAIGAGAHGVNLHLDPADLVRLVRADLADVTNPAG
ncbi:MAG TPA: YbaK/EbsC family protein [Actinomycetota bacterium]|nr:YbaK/EbsC family protein [Actinomycetota bacterium]